MKDIDLAKIIAARLVADYNTGDSYVDPTARRVHKAAVKQVTTNIALELTKQAPDITEVLAVVASDMRIVSAREESASAPDWTLDESGRANASARFNQLVAEIEGIILGSGHDLIHGHAHMVAGVILAQLAHAHGLAPKP